MRYATIVVMLFPLMVGLMFLGHDEIQTAEAMAQGYCDMVDIWNRDAMAGIPPEHRRGWPAYRPEIQCEL